MLFNSTAFVLFLPVVWALYWALRRSLRAQNLLVVLASYLFYGWWDWRFLGLIAFTSAWSYVVGLLELRRWESRPSKALLAVSLVVNLGILGFFKYCNFFVESLVDLLRLFGCESLLDVPTLSVMLPVGISFYTFQALSYTIDVYRRQVRPTRDPVAFFAFISFFPQLVAGPIERAANLLPQFLRSRTFDPADAVVGCRQMLWGFFKKMVVADNCAIVVNHLLNDPAHSNGFAVVLGALLFAFQVYSDFSGYSDIAIGCSRLFGVKLMRNFAVPFFSRDVTEFWRRWHISLMTWFRDYLYIPLGGGRCSRARKILNVFALFTVSGLWHGANWTFVCWGVVCAATFLPVLLAGRKGGRYDDAVVAERRALPTPRELACMVRTFALFVFSMMFFRASSLPEAFRWIRSVFDPRAWGGVADLPREIWTSLACSAVLLCVEWFNRREDFEFARLPRSRALRWCVYYLVLVAIVYWSPVAQSFVYFQF